MKKPEIRFLKRLGLTLLPFLLFLVFTDLYIRFSDNAFSLRARYIQHHDNSEIVFLGSSHTEKSINPTELSIPGVNLANPSQDIQLDSALFFQNISHLQHLHYLALEIDYVSLEYRMPNDFFRMALYYHYYGIQLYPLSLLKKVSIYAANPTFFNQYVIRKWTPFGFHYKYNQFGNFLNDFPGIFEDLNYDSLKIEKTAIERLRYKHKSESLPDFKFNKRVINNIIGYCIEHKIKVIILKNPQYITYRQCYVPAKEKRREALIDYLKNKYPEIHVFDFENSPGFTAKDYVNDDHLNPRGCIKLTKLFNQKLKNLIDQNRSNSLAVISGK